MDGVRLTGLLAATAIAFCVVIGGASAESESPAAAPTQVAPAVSVSHVESGATDKTTAASAGARQAAGGDAGAKPANSISVRVDAIAPVEIKGESPQGISIKDWAPAIGGLLGLMGALAAVWMGMRNTRQTIEAGQRNADASMATAQRTNEATLWQKANETELRDIQAKLDSFYGPFMQMSASNHLLAQEFRNRQPDKETYRLVAKVFDKSWLDTLSQGDRAVVREICQNAAVLEGFIRDRAALVDEQLLPYLSRASAHFRILHLAHKGDLGTDATNFLRYLYPYQLDNVLALEVRRLKLRCIQIRAAPHSSPGPMPPLAIPLDHDHQLPSWPSPPRAPLESVQASLGGNRSEHSDRTPAKET